MSFGAPAYLSLLLLAGGGGALAIWWMFWRERARKRFGAMRGGGRIASYATAALLVGALAVAAVAAARPQAGSRSVQVEQHGVDMVIVLDVSNSMLADDVQPSRLGRAQAEIDALLQRMQGNHVGLVMFARQAFGRSPLTTDMQALRGIVDGIAGERALVPAGSDLTGAIATAQRLLAAGNAATKTMLIVSDGEDRGSGVAAAGDAARRTGTRVDTAGVGTAAGAPVRDIDAATGVSRVRLDALGNPVVTRLDAAALQSIAAAGGGRYIALSGDGPRLASLASELRDLTQTTFASKPSSVPIERFQLFAAAALLLLAAPIAWPILRRPRTAARAASRLWPLAGAGLLIGAVCSTTVAGLNRQGNNAYSLGEFETSLGYYRTAQAKAPARPELYYNAGNAYDRSGQYDKAIDETLRALPATKDLVARIEYALGNHYAGASKLVNALEAYRRSLLADPTDLDAKHNLEVVTARLTPSPSPTATPQERTTPAPNPTAASASTPDAAQGGTPAATPGSANAPATPGAGEGQLTQAELERALAEALAGKDRQYTPQEAIRVLNLLDEVNRRAVEQRAGGAAGAPPPDY